MMWGFYKLRCIDFLKYFFLIIKRQSVFQKKYFSKFYGNVKLLKNNIFKNYGNMDFLKYIPLKNNTSGM